MADIEGELTVTDKILERGKALTSGIAALEALEATGALERPMVGLVLKTYRKRLRAIVATPPPGVSEEILSASERISEDRPAIWLSEN